MASPPDPLFNGGPDHEGLPRTDLRRGYAVALDFDGDVLMRGLGDLYQHARAEINRVLWPYGFCWRHGWVYFGSDDVNAVTCVLVVHELGRLPWFAAAVRDVRMLRIEELSDLMPAVHRANESGSR